jgi:hypothetical protein
VADAHFPIPIAFPRKRVIAPAKICISTPTAHPNKIMVVQTMGVS